MFGKLKVGVVIVVLLVGLTKGLGQDAPRAKLTRVNLVPSEFTESTETPKPDVLELPGQKLVFKPSRDDVTVGCAILSMFHSNLSTPLKLDALRVNGVQPKTSEIYLKEVGKNQFELPALKIEFSSKELGGPLY